MTATNHSTHWKITSAIPGIIWPAIPIDAGATTLALMFQLNRTQWLPADSLVQNQMRQLDRVLRHAHASVPYYRDRWRGCYDAAAAVDPERLAQLPLLTRRDLQDHFAALASTQTPASHGAVSEARTSGSTGAPVVVLKTELTGLLWRAITLRDHAWHRRDLRGKLAAIRHGFTPGEYPGWGAATDGLIATGPSVVRGVNADVKSHLVWLEQQQADYLITHPSLAGELARDSLARGLRLPRLRELRTYGELLSAEVREMCVEAWGVPVVDTYSTNEVGYVALQCPEHAHYHAQSESLVVEVISDSGKPCAPGEVGRIVVTTLHNFAMPLVRYALGDYAEVGEPCSCGRGLPVLRRILGRVRNMLVTRTGERYWPALGSRKISELAPVRQYQLVQKSTELIELRLVTGEPLSGDQESKLKAYIAALLPGEFRVQITCCENIPRSIGGKFEDFMSELDGEAR